MSIEAKHFFQLFEGDPPLMEMANLPPRRTRLPFDIFVSEKTYAPVGHRPRLKVYDKGYESSVSIDDSILVLAGTAITGKAWKSLVQYIQLNRELLLLLWEGKIDQGAYIERQRSVP